ncbi:hypothetical protein DFH06DRAFT_1197863 [Mycena polygramma]|nr:hypothetical protein DFH06DRAFT_1197863 [Mycena polygramma]
MLVLTSLSFPALTSLSRMNLLCGKRSTSRDPGAPHSIPPVRSIPCACSNSSCMQPVSRPPNNPRPQHRRLRRLAHRARPPRTQRPLLAFMVPPKQSRPGSQTRDVHKRALGLEVLPFYPHRGAPARAGAHAPSARVLAAEARAGRGAAALRGHAHGAGCAAADAARAAAPPRRAAQEDAELSAVLAPGEPQWGGEVATRLWRTMEGIIFVGHG